MINRTLYRGLSKVYIWRIATLFQGLAAGRTRLYSIGREHTEKKNKKKIFELAGRKNTYLGDGEHSDEIDDKVAFEVAHGNLVGIRDELASAEDP